MNTTLIAAASCGAAALYSYMAYEQFQVQVRELEFSFPNLPPAFDGYTILHLSDLHITKLGLLEKRTMSIIESREVDACMITGDSTANPRACDNVRRLCSVIKHRDPIYMVLGNSEHKPWLDTEMLVDALSFDGLKMLLNSSATISRGDQSITVVGVDDPYSDPCLVGNARPHWDDVDAAFKGVDDRSFVVFLSHCPSITPQALARGADLLLAGHTHGGQIRIPGIGLIWSHMRANKALSAGVYTPHDLKRILHVDSTSSTLFVSRGIGTSQFHVRLFCRPEVVYITLRKG